MLSILIGFLLIGVEPSFAKSKNDFSIESNDVIEVIENSICTLELYDENSVYYVGERIDLYIVNDEKVIEDNQSSTYPIYQDGKLILFVSYYDNTIKIHNSGVEEANEVIKSNVDFIIASDNRSAYLITNNDCIVICTNYNKEAGHLSENVINFITMKLKDYRYDEYIKITPGQREAYVVKSSFPSVPQNPYSNGCWAACIAAFSNYYKGTSYSVSTVANQYYPGTSASSVPKESMTTISNRLNTGYRIVMNSSNHSETVSNLAANITNNKLYIIGWGGDANPASKHVTCMYGYTQNANGTYTLNFMDPWGSGSVMSNYGIKYTLTQTGTTSFPKNNTIFGNLYGSYSFCEGLVYSYRY